MSQFLDLEYFTKPRSLSKNQLKDQITKLESDKAKLVEALKTIINKVSLAEQILAEIGE